MLRNVDDWDGQHFAFRADGLQDADRTVVSVHEGPAGPAVIIPDAHFLLHADFKRDGSDLILTGDHGKSAIVPDYFATDQRATLFAGNGMSLLPGVVEALAGPLAPGQYAQAGGAQQGAQAVGRVAKVDGNVTVVRNGVAITVKVGDAILKGDVLQTGSGQLGVTFNDGSTINLTENARLVVNEFIYDPNGTANSQILDLVQGSLSFISGEVAHSGDMKIGTPVATMGIRGTVGIITGAETDSVSFSIVQSERGAVLIDNNTGAEIAQVVQNGPLLVLRPAGPLQVIAEQVQKSPAELANELAALQHIVSIQAVGQQIIQQFFNPDPNNPQSNGTDHTQIQLEIPKSGIFADNTGGITGTGGSGGSDPTVTVTTTNFDPGTNTTEVIDQFTVPFPTGNLGPVIFTANPSATVSDEGQTGGIADQFGNTDSTDDVVAQGTIIAGDAEGDQLTFTLGAPAVALTSGGVDVTWQGVGTSTLTGMAGATPIITIAIGAHTGDYTVTVTGPVDHPDASSEDIITFNVPVNVSDGQTTNTTSLTVTIEDDQPVAVDYQENVSAGGAVAKTVNVVVILDVSGSMAGDNITLAKQALDGLLTTSNVQINQVMAVSFADDATVHLDNNSVWTDAASANAFIQGLVASGSTDYQDALAAVMANWGAGPSGADETLIYFISDGVPNSALTPGETTAWETFLGEKGVDVSYAIGISTSVNDPDLAPIAWTPDDAGFAPIILSDASGLNDTLQGTVSGTTHNIFDDASVGFGADGGRILSVDVDGVTYSWDGLNTISLSGLSTGTIAASMIALDTALGGHFEFYFDAANGHQAGDWSYLQPDQVAQLTDEVFEYVLIDNDGDTASADITVSVSAANFAPVIDAQGLVADDINSDDTLVTGLAVSDADDNGDPVALAVTVDNGTLTFNSQVQNVVIDGNGGSTPTVTGTINALNDLFDAGFVYSAAGVPNNDKITITVTDAQGATDALSFVFNANNPANTPVTLVGTAGNDFIFATGNNDALTGNGNSDTFVFVAEDLGGDDHITDLSLIDDFLLFGQTVFADVNAVLAAAASDGQGNTIITAGVNATITLDGVDNAQFQNIDHGHILIV